MTVEVQTERRRRELALRFASAAVLIPISVFAVSSGGWPLAIGAALTAAAIAFEWSRMTGARAGAYAIAFGFGANLVFPLHPQNVAVALAIGALIAAFLERGRSQRGAAAFGLIYATGMPLALQALRAYPQSGWEMAMGLMVVVWASDSAAYFVGRAFGGPRIAPQDSPNKTWSGAAGAAAASIATAAVFALVVQAAVVAWMLWGALVTIAAQAGDMFESQIKRRYGVKDASGLVPGHGGVLDRVDGLGAACVVATAVLAASPGVAVALGVK